MRLALRLAYKNLIGAGLRTWLNVSVLAFTFIVIIFYNALLNGWQEGSRLDGIAWEYGCGQLHHEGYDPDDPFSFTTGHGILNAAKQNHLTPILVWPGMIFPDQRMVPITIRGIDPTQNTLKLPTLRLGDNNAKTPAIIGSRMAASANLIVGDEIMLRFRDKNGTYDALEIKISGIFNTIVGSVDNGLIWISIDKLRAMTGLENHTSIFVASENYSPNSISDWKFVHQNTLLKDLYAAVEMERISSIVIYSLLLALALLALFDTQVLSIYRRQKEIGTYIALGMNRIEVLKLFTIEGSVYAILACVVGGIIGIPIFYFTSTYGISLVSGAQDMGLLMADTIYPLYSFSLIFGTFLLLVVSATLVSFLPARKIAKLNPVNALKGKIQ